MLLPTCVLISVVVVFVYVCVYCLSACIYVFTRCPHHPDSIHHSPSPSHPSRLHCTIRHPGLSHRYSTTPSILTQIKTFAPFSLTSLCPFSSSVALLLSFHFPPSHWCVFLSEERQTENIFRLFIILFFCVKLVIQTLLGLQGSLTHCVSLSTPLSVRLAFQRLSAHLWPP